MGQRTGSSIISIFFTSLCVLNHDAISAPSQMKSLAFLATFRSKYEHIEQHQQRQNKTACIPMKNTEANNTNLWQKLALSLNATFNIMKTEQDIQKAKDRNDLIMKQEHDDEQIRVIYGCFICIALSLLVVAMILVSQL